MRTSEREKPVTGIAQAVLFLLIVFALVLTLSPQPAAYAAGGDLDPTFGTGGIVTTDIGIDTNDEGNGVAIDSVGFVFVAGTTTTPGAVIGEGPHDDFVVALYNEGTLVGTETTDIGVNSSDKGNAVVIDANDQIIVAGTSDGDFAVARYNNSDGSLDDTFDTDGIVTTDFNNLGGGYTEAVGNAVAIDSNGKIVVVGYVQNGSEFRDFGVVRYNDDGSLDDTFNSGGALPPFAPGIVTTSVQFDENDQAYAVAIQSDNKIVVVGDTKGSPGIFVMARYNEDGSLDDTFDSDGVAYAASLKVATGRGVALQGDKIVVTGAKFVTDPNSTNCIDSAGKHCEYEDFWVARYNSDGLPDTDFGVDGEMTTAVNSRGNDDNGRAVAITPNNKIVVSGYTDSSLHTFSGEDEFFTRRNDFALARYNDNGTPDDTFGNSGVVITDFTPGFDEDEGHESHAVAIKTDGKIVAAGSRNRDFAAARYDAGTTVKEDTTTTITSHDPNPSQIGQAVVVNYTVTSSSGTPTGNVTVSDGEVDCTGTVADGTCTLTPTSAGVKTLTATYAGDGGFNGSAGTASHTVNDGTKTDTVTFFLQIEPSPSVVGEAVSIQVIVSTPSFDDPVPTGEVTVSDGTLSCTATLIPTENNNGSGVCQLTFVSAGVTTLTATYEGDSFFNGSSGTASHTVLPSADSEKVFLPVILR